jgi:hypothetical protein
MARSWRPHNATCQPSTRVPRNTAVPDHERNRVYTGDEFGGVIAFPFPSVALCRLIVHDKLIALAG